MFFIMIYAEDGRHEKGYKYFESAATEYINQLGLDVTVDDLREQYERKEPNKTLIACAMDDYGRSISLLECEKGKCRVCKKSGKMLRKLHIRVSKDNPERVEVPVCCTCAYDYEFGIWELRLRAGKPIIHRNYEDYKG